MVSYKIEKQIVLIMYLSCLWWSITTTRTHVVKAQNDSLKPGDESFVLVSKQGKFYISFTGIVGYNNEQKYLNIATWKVEYDLAWLYDITHPINLDSPVLSLDNFGVLKIKSKIGKPIIIYSPPQPLNNTVATILDTGNFVLQQIYPNGTKSLLWQSFDYPTYTLIPTMKLGVNRKTGHNWSLVSPSTRSITTLGKFSLEWEGSEGQLNIKKSGKVYWKSGKLGSNGLFENIPANVQHMYQYVIVSNKDEDSFALKLKDHQNYKKYIGWVLLSMGQLKSDEGDIANADLCYGYNIDGGCQKWEDIPTCRDEGEVFQKKTGTPNLESNATSTIRDNGFYDYSDCKVICWRNCNCTGFKELYDNGTGCIFYSWSSSKDVKFYDDDDFYLLVKPIKEAPKVAPKIVVAHHGKKRRIWIIAAIPAALLIICLFLICLAIIKQKYGFKDKKSKRKESKMQDLAGSNESYGIKDIEDELKGHDIKVFNYALIMEATIDFSPENKLGQGGYGPVYKGILPTGQEVAVKRLAKTSGQGIVEFKNELVLICELQHTNLVQLLGCCIHEEERILIYEYMPNKSLDFYLFDSTKKKFLDWKKRFNIIEGISQGILYLHKYSRLKIIHRDLKASNILLDENMNPKISDFGMARMFTLQESVVNTNRIVGTYGYMSPEYAMEGICSTKSDVYSFGVLLLEIVCGRKNNSFYDADRPLNLIGHAWELWNDGEYLQLLDPSLNDTFVPEEVQRCIHVGLLCVEQYASDRPTMSDVILMLTNKYELTTLPRRPAFYFRREILEGETTSKTAYTSTYSMTAISTSCEVEEKF